MLTPASRVWLVYQSNPENPDFKLAANAVAIDGAQSYYTWNQVSQNIPEAVNAGLPPGFDYSPWVPDGHIASGGRFAGNVSGLTYEGLDQASDQWPTTDVTAGETLTVDFYATAPHEPSVWDVWITTPDWNPDTPLNWAQMEFLGRPDNVDLQGNHYHFDVTIPVDRTGHHVLWIAWQRDDPVGEVFFSTSDLLIAAPAIFPESLEVTEGTLSGGGLNDLAASEDSDLSIQRDPFSVQSRTGIEVKATSTLQDPVQFEFHFEASYFGRSSVTQQIYFYNYNSDGYELVDTRPAQRLVDLAIQVSPGGDLSRFVQPGTGCVEARVELLSAQPRHRFTSNVDQAVWMIR